MKHVFIDMTGKVCGRLTVLKFLGTGSDQLSRFSCRCECGKETIVTGKSLRSGNTRSCGCVRGESTRTHGATSGLKPTRTYRSWQDMKKRCYNPKHEKYSRYGGRGIIVCERWIDSFENFLADMGERPLGMTIDRWPNKDGNYEPGNCRWSTQKTQTNNRSTNVHITVNGITKTLAQWADSTGIKLGTIWYRLHKGWKPDDIISPTIGRWRRPA